MTTPHDIRVRVARPGEEAALSALALRSKAVWGYDDAFMAACVAELTVPACMVAAGDVFVAEQAGRVLGFHAIGAGDEAGVAELEYLFVEPAELRRGIGGVLLNHAKSVLRSRGCRALLIQGDPHAADFYLGSGARPLGERASSSIPGRMLPLFMVELGGEE